jgi:Alginate lyase
MTYQLVFQHDSNAVYRTAMLVVIAALCSIGTCAAQSAGAAPPTVYWNGHRMARIKEEGTKSNLVDPDVFVHLRRNAESALRRGPYSVMDKSITPPSGDKHDYQSFSRYWWPNPDTPDGLPYVRRDGVVNEKLLAQGDRERIGQFYDDLDTLTLAAYFLDEPKFAAHAAKLIRVWFLDPATRMNPNLNFGQAVPGRAEGRGVGIIDTRHFIRVVDAIEVLHHTNELSDDDYADLQQWFRQYLDWLRSSENGKDERDADNNHGTWYDVQTARLALFVGDRDLARQIVAGARSNRIDRTIEADGRQPTELERTRSLHYSMFNLLAMCALARVGDAVGVDLWNYEAEDGGSIRVAMEFITPYLLKEQDWPHEQLSEVTISPNGTPLLLLTADRYAEPRFAEIFDKLAKSDADANYSTLVFP